LVITILYTQQNIKTMDINKIEEKFKELTKDEVRFLQEQVNAKTNEHGVYIYKSVDGSSSINLALVLSHYKEWLLDEGIHHEKIY
jgi:hypothetical protein